MKKTDTTIIYRKQRVNPEQKIAILRDYKDTSLLIADVLERNHVGRNTLYRILREETKKGGELDAKEKSSRKRRRS